MGRLLVAQTNWAKKWCWKCPLAMGLLRGTRDAAGTSASKQMKLRQISKAMVWAGACVGFGGGTRLVILSAVVGWTAQSLSVQHAHAPSAPAES